MQVHYAYSVTETVYWSHILFDHDRLLKVAKTLSFKNITPLYHKVIFGQSRLLPFNMI